MTFKPKEIVADEWSKFLTGYKVRNGQDLSNDVASEAISTLIAEKAKALIKHSFGDWPVADLILLGDVISNVGTGGGEVRSEGHPKTVSDVLSRKPKKDQ